MILWNSLQWHHNGHDGVSNHQPHNCLLNSLFRGRSKKTSKLCITGLCAGNSSVTGEFPTQMASNRENVSIWRCHHVSRNIPLVTKNFRKKTPNTGFMGFRKSCWQTYISFALTHQYGASSLNYLASSKAVTKFTMTSWLVQWHLKLLASRLFTVCSAADQRKHQSSASLGFVRGIHRWPVNSLHKGPVTRKMFPFDDVIMIRFWGLNTIADFRKCFIWD